MFKKKAPDPNLSAAMEEIRAICKKRNIAGQIILASPNATQFAWLLDIPDWSCLSFEKTGVGSGVRIRARPIEDKFLLDSTTHMIFAFSDLSVKAAKFYDGLKAKLKSHVTILHLDNYNRGPDPTPHDRN